MKIRMTKSRKDALTRLITFAVFTAPLFFLAVPAMTWIGIGVALLMLPFKYFYDIGWLSLEAMMKPVNALSKTGSFIFSNLNAFAWVLNILLITPALFYVFDFLSPFKSPFKGHWYGPLNLIKDLVVVFDFRSPKKASAQESLSITPESELNTELSFEGGRDLEKASTIEQVKKDIEELRKNILEAIDANIDTLSEDIRVLSNNIEAFKIESFKSNPQPQIFALDKVRANDDSSDELSDSGSRLLAFKKTTNL